ncbi:MAG: DUF2269 domain-containing protein [Pseudonocardiaceae bacterium]|nr:DUF2269 domain-containing protein [Pseudonocardiaceae bacterium]
MTPRLRKFTLTAHVTSSVGWLGAVAAYLALAVIGLTSQDTQVMRAVHLAMEPTAWYVIVPLALASLFTGLVSSLGTPWGLFRHYWVLFKLVISVFSSIILLTYVQSIGYFAEVAARTSLSSAELSELRNPTHVVHSGGGLLLLLVATALAVYKPRGMTRHGQRKQRKQRARQHEQPTALVP